jgi:signal transduction histidine kinase
LSLSMPSKAFRFLRRQGPWRILAIASAFLLLLAYIDLLTGPDIRLGVFYLVPLILVTLFVGRMAGFIMASVSAAMWFTTEVLDGSLYTHRFAAVPNAIFRLIFFLVATHLLAAWKAFGQRLESQIQERTSDLSAEIAERKQAEQSLHKLSLQLADAEDAQRRQLAHDIHDALGQTLSVIKLRLESAAARNGNGSDNRAAFADALGLVNSVIAQTRSLTFELHPPMLDDLGLGPALRWYAREFAGRTDISVAVEEQGEPIKMPQSLASYLFRSLKELINNGAKHGRATEIIITLYWRPMEVRIVVDDNGQGFEPAAVPAFPAAGLGLAGIREQADTLGGKLVIESHPGKGARAILQVPLAF